MIEYRNGIPFYIQSNYLNLAVGGRNIKKGSD